MAIDDYEQLTLFDTVAEPEVAPVRRREDASRPRYRRLSGTLAGLCDDCVLALYQARWKGPAPLRAVWERRVGTVKLRLCQSHGSQARQRDGVGSYG